MISWTGSTICGLVNISELEPVSNILYVRLGRLTNVDSMLDVLVFVTFLWWD